MTIPNHVTKKSSDDNSTLNDYAEPEQALRASDRSGPQANLHSSLGLVIIAVGVTTSNAADTVLPQGYGLPSNGANAVPPKEYRY